MLVIIIGESCSGKTTAERLLRERGFSPILEYTTRTPRDDERDGETYHFVSRSVFDEMEHNHDFAYCRTFNTDFGGLSYGVRKSDLEGDLDADRVLVTNPAGLRCIKHSLGTDNVQCFAVMLSVRSDVLWKRSVKRGDSQKEFERRLKRDKESFNEVRSLCDLVIETDRAPDAIADIIIDRARRYAKECIENAS